MPLRGLFALLAADESAADSALRGLRGLRVEAEALILPSPALEMVSVTEREDRCPFCCFGVPPMPLPLPIMAAMLVGLLGTSREDDDGDATVGLAMSLSEKYAVLHGCFLKRHSAHRVRDERVTRRREMLLDSRSRNNTTQRNERRGLA